MNNIGNLLSMFNKLTQNPAQTLIESGLNIPSNLTNNPQGIIQHLLNTNQISQQQVNQAMQMRNNPMFRGLMK